MASFESSPRFGALITLRSHILFRGTSTQSGRPSVPTISTIGFVIKIMCSGAPSLFNYGTGTTTKSNKRYVMLDFANLSCMEVPISIISITAASG